MQSLMLLAATALPSPLAPDARALDSNSLTAEPAFTAPVAVAPMWVEDWDGGDTYLRLNGGFMTVADSDGPSEDVEFDEGYLLAVGLGQRLTEGERTLNFDLELEGVWTDTDVDDSGAIQAIEDVSTIGVLLNGMLDVRLADRFSLYGGAGIGLAWMDVGTESDAVNDFEDEDGPFLAWQAKAGVMWRTSPEFAILLGYRFLNVDDNEIDDDLGGAEFDLETEQHILEAGLRFGF